jgi:hypothetical protein
MGYHRGPKGWQFLSPDARGRLDLSPVGVFLASEGDRLWLYEAATEKRLLDLMAATIAKEEAEAKAREEAKQRADLEERLRELERQLRSQQGQD